MPRPRKHALYSTRLSRRGRLCHKARHKECLTACYSWIVLPPFLAFDGARWSNSARLRGMLRNRLTRPLLSLPEPEGWELPFRTGRTSSLGDRAAPASFRSRAALPGKGSPHPHSGRITEGLGRGRPLLQKGTGDGRSMTPHLACLAENLRTLSYRPLKWDTRPTHW